MQFHWFEKTEDKDLFSEEADGKKEFVEKKVGKPLIICSGVLKLLGCLTCSHTIGKSTIS